MRDLQRQESRTGLVCGSLEQRAEEIEEYKQYTKSREYIEEVAREKLGLVYEGEVIFKEGSSY